MKLFIIVSSFLTLAAPAQNTSKLLGTWEGKINVGVILRLVFNFTRDSSGNINGISYSPDQGNKAIPCTKINIQSDSKYFFQH
jgi:hypothetical protein